MQTEGMETVMKLFEQTSKNTDNAEQVQNSRYSIHSTAIWFYCNSFLSLSRKHQIVAKKRKRKL